LVWVGAEVVVARELASGAAAKANKQNVSEWIRSTIHATLQ
jgi:ssRNA-specific RNase YbeY (16S rRNA maturation enzyme)